MPLFTKLGAKYVVRKFLDWAEKKGYSRNAERDTMLDILVPYVVAMIELIMGKQVGDEIYERPDDITIKERPPVRPDAGWEKRAIRHIKNL